MKTLEELKNEEELLLNFLERNKELQKQLYTKEFIEKHGIDIGDEIEYTYSRDTKRGIISGLEYMGYKPYRYFMRPFKKDGNISKIELRCWWSFNKNNIKLIKKA